MLEGPAELLWRQVLPDWIDDGIPSSQNFKPTRKDEGRLSTRRSAMMSAQEAYDDHTKQWRSAGTWGVSVAEAKGAGLRAIDDSAMPDSPFAHSYVDFRNLSRGKTDKAAIALKDFAVARGRAYPAAGDS